MVQSGGKGYEGNPADCSVPSCAYLAVQSLASSAQAPQALLKSCHPPSTPAVREEQAWLLASGHDPGLSHVTGPRLKTCL